MGRFSIWNDTDNIPATIEVFDTKAKAEKRINDLRDNFRKTQGYYRTNRWEKISPDDIQYRVINLKFSKFGI
jgi:hypothetical protein